MRNSQVTAPAIAGSILRASAETTEEMKRLSVASLPFGVLVYLLIAIGGTLVASRWVAPKKGFACCSSDVCAREHHHASHN